MVSMGGWSEGQECAEPGARTPIGAGVIFKPNFLVLIRIKFYCSFHIHNFVVLLDNFLKALWITIKQNWQCCQAFIQISNFFLNIRSGVFWAWSSTGTPFSQILDHFLTHLGQMWAARTSELERSYRSELDENILSSIGTRIVWFHQE